jgi:hypothetical protein
LKGHGHKHRSQREGCCDNGKGHLTCAKNRGVDHLFAELNTAVNIFQHHNRVVDHQTDAQDESEQGENIDRKSQRRNDSK